MPLKGKTQTKEELVATAFRLPRSLVERIDAHAERLSQKLRGMVVHRGDAVKVLLTDALDRAEKDK